jgi:uncharacterized membrane protein
VRLTVRNLNEEMEECLTVGQRTADAVANSTGSWRFILIQSGVLAFCVFLNEVAWIFDGMPIPIFC